MFQAATQIHFYSMISAKYPVLKVWETIDHLSTVPVYSWDLFCNSYIKEASLLTQWKSTQQAQHGTCTLHYIKNKLLILKNLWNSSYYILNVLNEPLQNFIEEKLFYIYNADKPKLYMLTKNCKMMDHLWPYKQNVQFSDNINILI